MKSQSKRRILASPTTSRSKTRCSRRWLRRAARCVRPAFVVSAPFSTHRRPRRRSSAASRTAKSPRPSSAPLRRLRTRRLRTSTTMRRRPSRSSRRPASSPSTRPARPCTRPRRRSAMRQQWTKTKTRTTRPCSWTRRCRTSRQRWSARTPSSRSWTRGIPYHVGARRSRAPASPLSTCSPKLVRFSPWFVPRN